MLLRDSDYYYDSSDSDYQYDTSDQFWFDNTIGPQTDRPTRKRQSSDTAPIVKFMKKRRRIARNVANNVPNNAEFELDNAEYMANADNLSNYKPPSFVATDSSLGSLNYQHVIDTLNNSSSRCNIIFEAIQDILVQEWAYNPNSAYGQSMPFMYLPYALVHNIYTTDNETLNRAIKRYKERNNTDIPTSFLKLTTDVLTNYITTSLYMYDNYVLPATEDNDRQGGRFVEFMIHTVFKYHIAAYELLNNFENNGPNESNVTWTTINSTAETLHITAQSLLNNNQLYAPIRQYQYILINTAKLLSIEKYRKNRILRAIRDPWFIASNDIVRDALGNVSTNAQIDPSSLVRSMYVLYSPLPSLVGSIEGDLWCTRKGNIEIIECKRYNCFSNSNKFHAFCQLFLYCNGYRKSIFENVTRDMSDITLTLIDITGKTEYKIKFYDLLILLNKVKIRGSNDMTVQDYLATYYIFGNYRSSINNYIVKVDKRKKNYL